MASRYKSKGDGTNNSDPERHANEPAPTHVAGYALMRLRVVLEHRLEGVTLESSLGQDCKKVIDATAELQRAAALVRPDTSELNHLLRIVIQQLLNAASDPLNRPPDVLRHLA